MVIQVLNSKLGITLRVSVTLLHYVFRSVLHFWFKICII